MIIALQGVVTKSETAKTSIPAASWMQPHKLVPLEALFLESYHDDSRRSTATYDGPILGGFACVHFRLNDLDASMEKGGYQGYD